jgi:hypothetical protein
MSESNRTRLAYIKEHTWNTTPASPELQALRITGESLVHNIDTITSAEIRSDRNVTSLVDTMYSSGGGFNFEFSAGTFDDLLAGVLFADISPESSATSSWWSDIDSSNAGEEYIVNGVTEHSFSIERAQLDKDEYFMFTGMVPNSMSLTVSAGAIVTGSFDFMGGLPATSLQQTTFDSSSNSTPTAAPTTDPYNGVGNVGTIEEGGIALSGVYLSEISFTISNNLRALPALGYNTAIDIAAGKIDVTGSVTAYFEDDSLYDKFTGFTDTKLSFTLTDGAGNYYTFYFPKVKYSSDTVNAGGQDADVMEVLNFTAIYDASTGGAVKITKSEPLV